MITAISITLMIIGLISVIYLISELSQRSRREMGSPKKKKIRRKGHHEK